MLIAALRESLPPNPWEALSYRLWEALEIAEEEAEFLGDECIGAAHLLLGLTVARGGIGARVLAELGVEAPRLRLLLGGSRPGAAATARVGVDEAARHVLRLMLGRSTCCSRCSRPTEAGRSGYSSASASRWTGSGRASWTRSRGPRQRGRRPPGRAVTAERGQRARGS